MVVVHAGASYVGTAHHAIQLCCKSCSRAGFAGLSCQLSVHQGLLIITSLPIPITGLYKFSLVTKEGTKEGPRLQVALALALGSFAITAAK